MDVDIQKLLDNMKKYMAIPSPTGYTKEAIEEVQKDFEKLGLTTNLISNCETLSKN